MSTEPVPGSKPAPFLVSWNLTRLCNLACGHCYLAAVQRKRQARDELTTLEAREVVRQLAELAPGAMVVFSGGEPLMRPDLIPLVQAAGASGLMPVIGTNGTLLNPRSAAELKSAGATGVGISLDSAEPAFHDRLRRQPGAWNAALRGAAAAREAGLAVLVQSTVFEENRNQLATLAALSASHGAAAFNVFFLVCTGRGATRTDLSPQAYEETLGEIVRLQREHPGMKVRARCAPYLRRMLGLHVGEVGQGYADWSSACLAGRRYFRITPQGHITPCPYIPESVGDVRKTPLLEIWSGHRVLNRLRNELPRGKCGTCDYRYSCGGCRARAFAATGDLMAEDIQCRYVKPAAQAPEIRFVDRPRASVVWEPEAEARMLRVPVFLRDFVRARLEKHAANEGVARISAAFLARHRPPWLRAKSEKETTTN